MSNGTRTPAATSRAACSGGSGFAATRGRSPTTMRVRVRSDSALATCRPRPAIGARAMSSGSMISHVRGAISDGVCNEFQICSAPGRMLVSFGVFASMVLAACCSCSFTTGASFQSVMSRLMNVTLQRWPNSIGRAFVRVRRRQFSSHSRCASRAM